MHSLRPQHDWANVSSNTAQVLTSLAEAISEGKKPSGSPKDEALRLFQESLDLFQRCLNVQEFRLTQNEENNRQEAHPSPDEYSANVNNVSSPASNASEEEVWASVEEPVTREALLDTIIAQLDTLTAICTLGSSNGLTLSYVMKPANTTVATDRASTGLAWVGDYYRTTLKDRIASYVDGSSRYHEVTLAQAKLTCALSDEAFRDGRLDLLTYERELNDAFTTPHLDISNDPPSLCDKADAELAFNASVQAAVPEAQIAELGQISTMCWKHITKALDSLTAASKLPDAQNLPRIHLRRGDCELLRLQLGDAPLKYDLAAKSAATLLKNAEVYFRGAANLAKRDPAAEEEEHKEAEVKYAIVAGLAGDTEKLSWLLKTQRELVESITKEMRDDGLLGEETLQKIGKMFA